MRQRTDAPTQIDAFNKLYEGPSNPSTGQRIYAGWSAGSELGWRGVIGGPNVFPTAGQFFRNTVFRDASWDWRRFDFDKDWTYAIAHFGPLVNADGVDLRAFEQAGGKVLHDHGCGSAGPHPDQFDPMDALCISKA